MKHVQFLMLMAAEMCRRHGVSHPDLQHIGAEVESTAYHALVRSPCAAIHENGERCGKEGEMTINLLVSKLPNEELVISMSTVMYGESVFQGIYQSDIENFVTSTHAEKAVEKLLEHVLLTGTWHPYHKDMQGEEQTGSVGLH